MESGNTITRNLEIDGMRGDDCIQKVTGALKGVHGISTQSVKVGGATIGADQTGCTAACAAIDSVGFKSREGGAPANKGVTQSGAPAQNLVAEHAAAAIAGVKAERVNDAPVKPIAAI
jgi:copper chaperone CopZ